MRAVARGITLVGLVLVWMAGVLAAVAQAPTTTVQDTVYRADGTPAGGTVSISWGAFTTTGGTAVAAGSTTVTLGVGGLLSVALVPNGSSTPMGNYYTAIFHLNDGTTSREYWVVPYAIAGGGPVKLAAIANSVLPTAVAMQTVSKAYVDNAVAAALTGTPADDSPYVLKAGDAMTGPLVLPADPVSGNQAADKNYVDENVAAVSAGLGQKVSLFPTSTQVVSQPTGTQLEVNELNGQLYASQYLSGGGANGIQNALSSASCASGCTVEVEPTYATGELPNPSIMGSQTQVVDQRQGATAQTAVNPLLVGTNETAATSVNEVETISAPSFQVLRPGASGVDGRDMVLTNQAAAGGSNQFPADVETVPYFKSTYGVLKMTGTYNTQGQHVQAVNDINCYSVGDCLAGSQFLVSSGGYRDEADEGAHPFDLQVKEDSNVFVGTCSAGCTTGSTSVAVTASAGAGTQGDGRYLIDKNAAKTITTGQIISGSKTILGIATFSGTSFAVSTFLQTAQAATSQTANLAPGVVTLSIATTGVPSGFATNTAAVPSSGVACVADVVHNGQEFPNFEMANYSVVDGTHVRLTVTKVHNTGAVLAVGGLCGYGLEQTADTVSGIRQLFPVVGSISATSLYYGDGNTSIVGSSTSAVSYSTSGYLNYTGTLTTLVRSANVVTATTAANLPADVNGLTLTVSGATDTSYNGSYAVTTTGPNTFTYANTGANSTTTGGSASVLNGGFVLYPMAEVVSVLDPATKSVNGVLTLGPNTAAWASGDVVEEPHYYQQLVDADTELITQFVPKPAQYSSAGKFYAGTVGPGVRGWEITNGASTAGYLGGGGTHLPPDDAYKATGVWNNDMELDAGLNAVLKVNCNLHGCNRWDSTYAVLELQSQVGQDFMSYSPQSNTMSWNLAGQVYSLSPTSMTAPTLNATTINATTLNATTLTGSLGAGSITSGTIGAARLPLFGASGGSHAVGAVPDPGATAGSTRYLREDGTWTVPPGTGGSMTWPTAAGVAVYAGSSAWGTSLTAPASALVGVSDTQTLTNKSIAASEVNSGTLATAQIPTTLPVVALQSSNGSQYGQIAQGASGTSMTLSRNSADAIAAVTSNNANSSSTGHIHDFQFNSSTAAYFDKTGNLFAGAFYSISGLNFGSYVPGYSGAGPTIARNSADAITALTVNNANASSTGDILDLQYGGTNKVTVDRFGNIVALGILKGLGSVQAAVAKTGAYTAATNDYLVLCNASTAAFAVSLPTSPLTGEVFKLKKTDSSSNACTLSGNGKNIDGGTTVVLSTQYQFTTVEYDGTQWWVN